MFSFKYLKRGTYYFVYNLNWQIRILRIYNIIFNLIAQTSINILKITLLIN